jgi:hypothetical protein
MPEPLLFRQAVEARDLTLMRDALAEDVVFHSPVLFRPFEGRDAALHVLETVVSLLSDFEYLAEAYDDNVVALHFKAKFGDREIEGIDLVELDGDGRASGLTVFMRPMTAVTEFSRAMAERLGAPS